MAAAVLATTARAYEVQYAFIQWDTSVVSWSTTAAVTSVSNPSAGRYTVNVDGILAPGQTMTPGVLVTGHGPGAGHCKLDSFSFAQVQVRCFTAAGQPVNSDFHLTFIPANNDRDIAYAYADNAAAAS